jgi:RHS repeat-associated protein
MQPATSGGGVQARTLSTASLALAIIALAVLGLPASASAAECTDTWTGPAEGSWTTASNWSAGHVPNESDVACIGSGKTVNITSGTQKVSVVQGEGALKIEKGTLELLSTSEASQINSLTMKFEAVLSGPATLKVTSAFSWSLLSTMSGSGSTIIEPAVSGSIAASKAYLVGRHFINRGTLTYSREIVMSEGALLENTGTLLAAAPETIRAEVSKTPPAIVNAGTLKKISGTSEAPIEVSFENRGTVNGEKGSFAFRKPTPTYTLAAGSVLEGGISFKEAHVTAESFSGSGAVRLMKKATMTIASGASATVGSLTMEFEANLNGPGTLTVSNNLAWTNESTMSGTGLTVLGPSASGSLTTGLGKAKIESRTFVNEGNLSVNAGLLRLSEGAVFENKGTTTVNDQEAGAPAIAPGEGKASPEFRNLGTVQKTAGNSTSRIQVNLVNLGTIKAETGTLGFDRKGQEVNLGPGTNFKGAILFSEANVTTGDFSTPGQVTLEKCQFSVPNGKTATFSENLTIKFANQISGEGTLRVSGTLAWTNESTMSGAGVTVIAPGGSATITTGGGKAKVVKRAFVNEGSLSVNAGLLRLSEGAALENSGTATVNLEEAGTQAIAVGEGIVQPEIRNTGTIRKTGGTGNSRIQVNLTNFGTINAETGTLAFDRKGQEILLDSGTTLKGAVLFSEANVTAGGISTPGRVTLEKAELHVPKGFTSTFSGELITKSGNKIDGEGTLAISGTLAWTNESTMSGAGTTVIAPGGTASITTGGGAARVVERGFVNEGSLLVNAGLLRLSEGAVLDNKGELTVNKEDPTAAIAAGETPTPPLLVNQGLLQKTAGTGTASVAVNVENSGRIDAASGKLAFDKKAGVVFLSGGSLLEGSILFEENTVGAETFASTGNLTIDHAALDVLEGAAPTVSELTMRFESLLTGPGTISIAGKLHWDLSSTMSGGGATVLLPASSSQIDVGASWVTVGRTLVNEGTLTMTEASRIEIIEGVRLKNLGTFRINSQPEYGFIELIRGKGHFLNSSSGTFERTEGTTTARVSAPFENLGVIHEKSSPISFDHAIKVESAEEFGKHACAGDPVDCATGNLAESQADLAIGGRGVGLSLNRTYSAQAAAAATSPGAFGYGWSSTFTDHLSVEEAGAKVTIIKGDGSMVPFTRTSGTSYAGPAWSRETVSGSPEAGYTFTALDRTAYRFSGTGRLESVTDRNGNETTLAYDEAGRLKTVTDPAGRQLTFSHNSGGQVESVEDPMGHLVKYAYEGGNLASVTMPGETSPRWQFKYDASHRLTQLTDGRGGKTTNEYDGSGRVISQTDPAGRTTTFTYEGFHTTLINKATGAVTDEWFTSNNEPYSITYGYGTTKATTKTFAYNEAGQLIRSTDGNGHSTTYGYDAEGNRTSEKDALGHETKWTYSAAHEVTSETTPRGETTTLKRDSKGNVESISRPVPGEATQTISFKRGEHGEVESFTDPLGHTRTYGYDSYGDPTSESDPLGHTRTMGYDKDSRLVLTVSPQGNLEGAEPSAYETMIERDPQGRPLRVTDPLGHVTEDSYDANGNLASSTDANGHATEYTYDADNEQTKLEKPSGAILETAYDGAGNISSQTDANKHTTTYVRNVLEQPVEAVDSLGRKTLAEFDAAGNLIKVTDPAERTTSYSYDAADRLIGINYSEEATPDASFEYDADGNVVATIDGTGKSTFAYDQLGRLTESMDGHGEAVKYSYDLGEEQVALAYPNGKEVTRAYDKAGRLESLTDWLGGKTSFSYDADSNLTGITFPGESGNTDEYSYDRASHLSEARFKQGAETLASLAYTRDPLGQVEHEARKGLPGAEEVSYGYDEGNRLVKAGAESFEYDPADNLTEGIGSTNAYDAASQLETGTGLTYTYDKLGERTKATPTGGPAISYGYDQAGDLTSISRPEEGEVPAISETLAYNGSGLLASKTTGLTTRHLAWDASAELPLLLSDGQHSYLYGPDGLPVEQINPEEERTYLHHDQLGSTRLLTGAGGETSAAFSYAPYGELEGSTGTSTTPLGFAGQYTDTETGLQYLRARSYDPGTGQFLTRDPIEELTREPYSYGSDNPLNRADPSGFAGELVGGGCAAGEVIDPLGGCVPGAAAGAIGEGLKYAGAGILGWLAAEASDTESTSNDEGEPCLEPRIDPWERDTQIGSGSQERTKAEQFADKLDTTAGSNPQSPFGNGPRWAQIAALIGRLLAALRGEA